MEAPPRLLLRRRFLPIFVTQFLGAFNDNLFRTSMVMLVIYGIYRDATQEATFSAVAGALFSLPFFLLSALAGQLADSSDKALWFIERTSVQRCICFARRGRYSQK